MRLKFPLWQMNYNLLQVCYPSYFHGFLKNELQCANLPKKLRGLEKNGK